MRYLIWLPFIFSAMAAATPFDLSLLSWPDPHYKSTVSTIHSSNMNGLWYKKEGQELSQKERDTSFNYITPYNSIVLDVFISKYDRSTVYRSDGNHFNFIDAGSEFNAGVDHKNYRLSLGNKVQSLAIKLNTTTFNIKRIKHARAFELDIQGELKDPKPGQFIFNYAWQDYSWLIAIKNPIYSITFEQYQHNYHDQKLTLTHQFNQWQHGLSHHEINLNYGYLALVDTEYEYGALSWFVSGEVWHYSIKKQQNKRWWEISFIDSNIKNRSSGSVGLINVIGVNAALTGTNWYYGLKADFKNSGIKFGSGWLPGNSLHLSEVQWEHSWKISLNRLQPNVNSKVYKSVILIGTPSLENEEQTNIEYLYGAGLNWRSKLIWQNFAMILSASQFVPITIKENELESDDGSSSGNESLTDNPEKSTNSHVGYTLGLDLIYSF